MARSYKISEFQAFRVYHDEKGQAVYLPLFSKDGYVIIAKDIGMFNIHSMRTAIAVMIGTLVFMLGHKVAGIGIGLLVLVGWEAYMRVKYLPSLPVVKNFVKPSPKEEKERFEKLSGGKKDERGAGTYFIVSLIGLAFAIVSYVNIGMQNFTGVILVLNYGLVLVGVYLFIRYAFEAIKKAIEGKK